MVKEFAEAQLKYYKEVYDKKKKIFDDPSTPPLSMRYAGCELIWLDKKIKHLEELIKEEEHGQRQKE